MEWYSWVTIFLIIGAIACIPIRIIRTRKFRKEIEQLKKEHEEIITKAEGNQ